MVESIRPANGTDGLSPRKFLLAFARFAARLCVWLLSRPGRYLIHCQPARMVGYLAVIQQVHEFVFGELKFLEIDAQGALIQIVSGVRLPQ